MNLTLRVNYCYTLWNVGFAISSTLENQKKEFDISLKIHCKDVYRQNAPQTDQHFKVPNHNFNQHARFTLIEQLDNVNIDMDLAALQLKET